MSESDPIKSESGIFESECDPINSEGTPILSESNPIKSASEIFESGGNPIKPGGEMVSSGSEGMPRISQILTKIRVIRGKNNRVKHRQVPLYRSRFWKIRMDKSNVPMRYRTA